MREHAAVQVGIEVRHARFRGQRFEPLPPLASELLVQDQARSQSEDAIGQSARIPGTDEQARPEWRLIVASSPPRGLENRTGSLIPRNGSGFRMREGHALIEGCPTGR
jgi:hypothetical protein